MHYQTFEQTDITVYIVLTSIHIPIAIPTHTPGVLTEKLKASTRIQTFTRGCVRLCISLAAVRTTRTWRTRDLGCRTAAILVEGRKSRTENITYIRRNRAGDVVLVDSNRAEPAQSTELRR